jgi:hypothetical protein
MVTTVFCYCKGALSLYSQDVRVITRQLTEGRDIPVVPRDALPCHSDSTVIVFNAYGHVDNDYLASICSTVSCVVAVAVYDHDYSFSSPPPKPDMFGDVKVRPAWLHLAPSSIPSLSPPERLTLTDDSATSSTESQWTTTLCSVCRSETKNNRGLCWRHRPGKCFNALIH